MIVIGNISRTQLTLLYLELMEKKRVEVEFYDEIREKANISTQFGILFYIKNYATDSEIKLIYHIVKKWMNDSSRCSNA